MTKILGVVLAGGLSTRFGSDKAQALWRGRSLLDHALDALAPHCASLAVCGRDYPGVTVLADRPEPGQGPLGGLNAALHHAQAHGFDGVLVTGCDMPVFPAALAAALVGDGPAVLEGSHLAGWWPASLAPLLDAHLATETNRSLRCWFDKTAPRHVRVPDFAMPNINRPEDLDGMEKG
ncbi:putative molybdopterin-guanine dinucleotide biosynthesis protein [Novosphingobium nitrogenifigens DSM 19370]|uniref:Molybdenum cofactor guanylyltransferase n=1 Tax=Novosphingobium nitrogenifigens DSM 19370 TaxID=983920 RepID=F1Z795_9SPHN|nr:molybdenum cofactor guanylyltransferase [Novosphingobium nitrogenifigens]EGD59513.1 putative molybdopterin-guanine dinucleotide biosynthesis protein [Novosphingobium nitrogenifigens DSM 19370]